MEKKDSITSVVDGFALAGELGFLIAIPLVVLVLIGVWLDKRFGTLPLFVITGIVLAAATSALTIFRRIKELS